MKGVEWRLEAQELCIAIVLASCCLLLHLLLLLQLLRVLPLPLITQHVRTIHNHPRGSVERGANADQQKLISTTVALRVQDQVVVEAGAGAGAVEIMQRSNNGSRNNNTTPGLCHFCYSFERFPSLSLSLCSFWGTTHKIKSDSER